MSHGFNHAITDNRAVGVMAALAVIRDVVNSLSTHLMEKVTKF